MSKDEVAQIACKIVAVYLIVEMTNTSAAAMQSRRC
jgi:hypothetical protein